MMTGYQDSETIMRLAIKKARETTLEELLNDPAFCADPYNYPFPITAAMKRWLSDTEKRSADIRERVIASIGDETEIDTLVRRYLQEHPGYLFPSSDKHLHSSVLAFNMWSWMSEKLGGSYEYMEALLRSAKVWFSDGKLEELRILFAQRFAQILLIDWPNEDPRYLRVQDIFIQLAEGKTWVPQ